MDNFTRLLNEVNRNVDVIGKTRSGKPIYDDPNHPSYKSFSWKDHGDVTKAYFKAEKDAKLQMKIASKTSVHHPTNPLDTGPSKKLVKKHADEAEKYKKAAYYHSEEGHRKQALERDV